MLFLSAGLRPAISYHLVEAGAAGVLNKDSTPEAVADALPALGESEETRAQLRRLMRTMVQRHRDRGTYTREP